MTLAVRAGLLAAALATEKFLLNFFVDFSAAQRAQGLGALVRVAQHWGFRFAVTSGACLALFTFVRSNEDLRGANVAASDAPIRARWLLVHALLLLPLALLSYSLYGNHFLSLPFVLLSGLWALCALAGALALVIALAPWEIWRQAMSSIGVLWTYSALAGAAAVSAMGWSQMLWRPTAGLTFDLVRRFLTPLIPSLRADPINLILSTGRFSVQIADVCSGLEGIGLMLAFCCAWLVYFRRDYRFPRALIMVPIGLLVIFTLNGVRLAALVLIGHFGSPDIAIYGFHSQAGWIGFNCAAAGLVIVSRRIAWLNRADTGAAQKARPRAVKLENPTAVYLAPFLALLAAAMIARAVSGSFETWYGLRLPAVLLALVYSWPKLRTLDWRFSWRGVAAGAGVFGLWILLARVLKPATPIPPALLAWAPVSRGLWIAVRVMTAVLVVPIAEELAYRGYLLRRLIAADFESVSFMAVGIWRLVVTAIAFGAVHGSLWPAGLAAGLVYGALVMRTGRIGEAVAAHGVTNGLLAAAVLLGGQWQLW